MKPSPRKRLTIEFLASRCRAGVLQTGERLPPLRILADQAGVALVTMQQTIAWCKRNGYIDRHHRIARPVRTGDEAVRAEFFLSSSRAPETRKLWRRTADRFKKDLNEGAFRPGETLPSIKELCVRYGVSYPTMKKIFRHLLQERILDDRHGHLSVPPVALPGEHLRIVLLIRGFNNGRMVAGTLDVEFIRCMEHECRKAHLGMDLVLHAEAPQDLQFWRCGSGERIYFGDLRDTAGFVYVVNGQESRRDDLISLLTTMGGRTTLQDHFGISPLPHSVRSNPRCRVFSSSIFSSAGLTVGRYLQGRGHRRIAFISPFHGDQEWSHQRLSGLQGAFQGVADSEIRVASLPHSTLTELFEPEDRSPEFAQALEAFNSWRGTLSPEIAWAVPSGSSKPAPNWLGWGRAYEKLKPLFSDLLADPRITVWVCVNDSVALMAMDFLKRRKVAVGSTLSVIGFDDVREALEHQLTSFNYNIPSCAHAALMYLLNRSTPADDVVEVEGYVVERGSVALLPRQRPARKPSA